MKKWKSLVRWIKKNKKKLIAAGISFGALLVLIYSIKNSSDLQAWLESLLNTADAAPEEAPVDSVEAEEEISITSVQQIIATVAVGTEKCPHSVARHIRNLHEGWHASPEKIAEAEALGIKLLDGQTLIDDYETGLAA